MRSQRSDVLILLLSIVPVGLGIALVLHANSDGPSMYFANAPEASLPSFVPSQVNVALQPFLNWAATISYMPLVTREEMALGIVIGGIGAIVIVMCLLDLFTSARRTRKMQVDERGAPGVNAVDEPLQMYVAASRSTDRGVSA